MNIGEINDKISEKAEKFPISQILRYSVVVLSLFAISANFIPILSLTILEIIVFDFSLVVASLAVHHLSEMAIVVLNQNIDIKQDFRPVVANNLVSSPNSSLSNDEVVSPELSKKITNAYLEEFKAEGDVVGVGKSAQYGIITPFKEVDGSNLAKMHKHAQVDEGFFDDESSQYGIIKPFEEVESSNVVKAHTHIKVEKGFFDEDPSDVNISLEQAVEILDRQDLENGGGYADLIPDEPAEPMKFGR
jgi:hypothetical protein